MTQAFVPCLTINPSNARLSHSSSFVCPRRQPRTLRNLPFFSNISTAPTRITPSTCTASSTSAQQQPTDNAPTVPLPLSDSPPQAPHSVRNANPVIVGAGPVGMLTAIMLVQRGIPVTLIDRSPDPSVLDISLAYVFSINSRGQNVLRACRGLFEKIAAVCQILPTIRVAKLSPQGNVQTLSSPLTNNTTSSLFLLRSEILRIMTEYIAHSNLLTTIYATSITHVHFLKDGSMQLALRTAGRSRNITSRFLMACDGKNSAVLASLRASPKQHVTSTRGFVDRAWTIPSSHIRIKALLLNDHARHTVASAMPDGLPGDTAFSFSGDTNGRNARSVFRLAAFVISPEARKRTGGWLGTVTGRDDDAVHRIRDVEEMFQLFEENFPQMNVRQCIDYDNMRHFVESKGTRFGKVRRAASITAVIGDGEWNTRGGVVVMGDAAHSFPPDLGLGVNTGMEDVGVLMSVLDAAEPNTSLRDIVKRYEQLRDKDTEGVTFVHRHGDPWRYNQSKWRMMLWGLKMLFRIKLAKAFPQMLYPPAFIMGVEGLPFGEAMKRANLTTLRLCAFVAILMAVVLLLALLVLARLTT